MYSGRIAESLFGKTDIVIWVYYTFASKRSSKNFLAVIREAGFADHDTL